MLIAQTCNQDIFRPGLIATIISLQPGLFATEPGLFATSLQSSISARINCNYKLLALKITFLRKIKVVAPPPAFVHVIHANAPDRVAQEIAV